MSEKSANHSKVHKHGFVPPKIPEKPNPGSGYVPPKIPEKPGKPKPSKNSGTKNK